MSHLSAAVHAGLVSLQQLFHLSLVSLQQLVVVLDPRSLLLRLLPLVALILVAQILGGTDATVVVTNTWQWWKQRHLA